MLYGGFLVAFRAGGVRNLSGTIQNFSASPSPFFLMVVIEFTKLGSTLYSARSMIEKIKRGSSYLGLCSSFPLKDLCYSNWGLICMIFFLEK